MPYFEKNSRVVLHSEQPTTNKKERIKRTKMKSIVSLATINKKIIRFPVMLPA